MNFVCPTCGKEIPRELEHIIEHTEDHIVNQIKKNHPDWQEKNGLCEKCYKFYKEQMSK
jgi:hypothetical protein